jgi:microcystin degradation protein MlrC
VSAGAPGENVVLVEKLLTRGRGLRVYAAMRDPALVRSLVSTPLDSTLEVTLGGKLDPDRNAPLTVRARLRARDAMPGIGDRVLLELGEDGAGARVALVVTDGPPLAVKPEFFERFGLSIGAADVVVVKNFFPFHLFYARWERSFLYVRTSGVTDLDAALGLDFAGPVHPKDQLDDWVAEDRRRRGFALG